MSRGWLGRLADALANACMGCTGEPRARRYEYSGPARIEVFGHRRHVGIVTPVRLYGADGIEIRDSKDELHVYGAAAVFSIQPISAQEWAAEVREVVLCRARERIMAHLARVGTATRKALVQEAADALEVSDVVVEDAFGQLDQRNDIYPVDGGDFWESDDRRYVRQLVYRTVLRLVSRDDFCTGAEIIEALRRDKLDEVEVSDNAVHEMLTPLVLRGVLIRVTSPEGIDDGIARGKNFDDACPAYEDEIPF